MEPKLKITTRKGTVFNSMQDYRKASASAGVPLDDMSDDQIAEQFSKPSKPGEQPAITIQYEGTAPPPASPKEPSLASKAASAVTEFISGLGTSVSGIPAQLMRAVGVDPSKVEVPVAPSPMMGAPAPMMVAPSWGYNLKQKTTKPLTFADIGKAPETTAGQAGEIVGDILQVAAGTGAAAAALKGAVALPKVSKAVSATMKALAPVTKKAAEISAKAPKAAKIAKEAVDIAQRGITGAASSALQEASKTGELDQAFENAKTGAAVDTILTAFGRGAKSVAAPLQKWTAQKALFLITDDPQYHKDLANRLIETSTKFTDKGVSDIEKRFSGIVGAMKQSSKQADYLINRVNSLISSGKVKDPQGVIPSDGRVLPFPQLLEKNFNQYSKGGKGLGVELSQRIQRIYDDIKKTLPTDEATGQPARLTFKEAEDYKQSIQKTLTDLYNNPDLNVDEKTQKQIRKIVADSMRQSQRFGFDVLKNAFSKLQGIPGTGIEKIKPWQVKVPGLTRPVDYRQAGQMAMKDSDLLAIGKTNQLRYLPQEKQQTGQSLMDSISLSQLAHGSIFTPSQVAATAMFMTPARKTQAIEVLGKLSRAKPPVTSPVGTTAFSRLLGEKKTSEPPIEGISDVEEVTIDPNYKFKD
jgi:hypothetical protein